MKLCMGCMEDIEDHITTCPYCGYNETELRQESYYLDPGTVVGGRYIVGRVISYGGYAITYLGMDAGQNRKVTVREYLPSDFSTRSEGEKEVTIYSGDALEQFEQGLTTFLNEANRVQHLEDIPGIARVYDCVAENDTGYVISEYLQGQTLGEILDTGEIYTPQEAKDLISQILVGLQQVHQMDIVHCDIAPETIMVTESGEVKLLDFGAARYVTTANSKSLAIILKQGYAPEEQYRSRGVRGPWTDVYALAAVMYRMITGKVPDESVDRALIDELKEPSQMGVEIPQNMENALMNALNIYQKDRTPSAEAFLNELNSAQVKRIQVKKRRYETGRFPRWAKGLVAGLLLLVVAGGAVIGYSVMHDDVQQTKNTDVLIPNIIDTTEEEAEKALGDIELVETKVYYSTDLGAKSRILSQQPAAGSKAQDNKVSCEVLSGLKCNYSDILENSDSVRSLAKYLNLDESVCAAATGEDKADENKSFYNLYSVVLQDGKELSLKELQEDKVIEIKDIKKLVYYVSPFFYENPIKNYVGSYIGNIRLKKYIMEGDKKIETGETGEASASRKYYSLSSQYKEGYIVKQNVKSGKEYNSSETDTTLFDVVKKEISWNSSSDPDELKKQIQSLDPNLTVKIEGTGNLTASVRASGAGTEKEGMLFVSGAVVTITRKEAPPTPAPSTPKPTQQPQKDPAPQKPAPAKPEDAL